jgi:hypothetical protein
LIRFLFISLIFIFAGPCAAFAAGHKIFNDSSGIAIEMSGDPIIDADTVSCVIPFTRVEKLILIKGKADSTEGNFIFDTGAPGLVLNVTYFRSYPITGTMDGEQKGIAGNADFYGKTTVNNFKLGTFSYYKVDADFVNLGHLESKRGVKILGLLGVSMFTQCEVIIDYEKNEIHLHYISKKERNTYQHEMITNAKNVVSSRFDLDENRILVKTSLAGKDLKFVVDFGSESNILDSRLPGKVLDSMEVTGRVLLNGAGTKTLEALSGTVMGFEVAGMETAPLPVIVTDLRYTCFGDGQCINGVLGYDFLSRYKLCFNFVKRMLYIIK